MKTLEKDRNRRYETASAFAADVQRYLNDELVQAYPPSVLHRIRKFVRRHKASIAAAGLVVCVLAMVLVVGIGIIVNNATRAERDRALENQQRAESAEQRALDAERENKIRAHLARAMASRQGG
jgi:non-specific serine/threonine protein kinase/serine/threonine-protein kinase